MFFLRLVAQNRCENALQIMVWKSIATHQCTNRIEFDDNRTTVKIYFRLGLEN